MANPYLRTTQGQRISPEDPNYEGFLKGGATQEIAPVSPAPNVVKAPNYYDQEKSIQGSPAFTPVDEAMGGIRNQQAPFPTTSDINQSYGFASNFLNDELEDKKKETEMATIRKESQRQAEIRQAEINAQFDIERQSTEKLGQRALGGTRARAAMTGGVGTSGLGTDVAGDTTTAQNLSIVLDETHKQMRDVERRRQEAINSADFSRANELKANIKELEDSYDKLFNRRVAIYNAALNTQQENRAQQAENRQADSARVSSEVSILNAIKDIPEGQSVEIGGSIFTGIKPPSVETQAFTDENGNVTFVDKNTGKKIGVVQGIGSKQKAANMQFHEVGNKIFVFDPETGKVQDSGVTTPDKDMNTLLTPAEAKALGVNYGTTRGQAASMGIMPSEVDGTRSFMDASGNIIEIGSKQLSPAQTQLLSEGKQLTDVLDPLYGIIKDKKNLFGPIRGYFGQKNPYATDSKKIDDDLRRASQVIGKYMEGGVLRKEDEEKYRKMLPQLTDTPEVAKDKLDGVAELLDKKQKQYIMDFGRAGYDVENFVKDATEVEKDPLKIMSEGDPLGLGFNQGDTGPNEGVVRAAMSGGRVEIPQSSRLAYVNNNPGNLRYANQMGAVKGDGNFAKFSTPQAGYQALLNQIKLDASRDLTLEQFINKYAPPSENNTNQYLQQMIQATGAKKNTKIKEIDLNLLGRAIAKKESSTVIG